MLRSFFDLLTNVLDRAEEESGLNQSEFYPLAAEFLDRVYYELLGRRPWMWSRAPAPYPLRVFAPVPTTVSWPAGSHVVTLPDPFIPSVVDVSHWKLLIRGKAYRVLRPGALGSSTVLMEMPWFGDGLVNEPVTAYKDEYAMLEIPDIPPPPTIQAVFAPPTVLPGIPPGIYHYFMTYIGSTGESGRSEATAGITLAADSNIVLSLPGHPGGNPHVIGRAVYRAFSTTDMGPVPFSTQYPGLITRVYPAYYGGVSEPVSITDSVAGPLVPDAPLAFGDNGTVCVRLIYGVYGRGEIREVDPMTEIRLREAFHDPTAQRWPPLAYARTSQNVITFSHQPLRDSIIDVYHTEIGKPLSLSTVNEIRIPPHFRHVLADAALALILEQKHSDRAAVWLGRIKDHILVMEAEDEKVKLGYDSLRRGTRHEAVR